jgi:hypothetical protein
MWASPNDVSLQTDVGASCRGSRRALLLGGRRHANAAQGSRNDACESPSCRRVSYTRAGALYKLQRRSCSPVHRPRAASVAVSDGAAASALPLPFAGAPSEPSGGACWAQNASDDGQTEH